ncbi:S1C family serine protease [Nocardiopsis flavescens]|uniref:S1C family serine protease n=1 Tax=Nocardiopsis flavescens TaxID=758803 RepID=UPI00366826F5
MNPNEPTPGTEPDASTGENTPGADAAGSVGGASAAHGATGPQGSEPSEGRGAGAPGPSEGTGPRFAPHDHPHEGARDQPPRWATGPNEADRVAFSFPPGDGEGTHQGGPGTGQVPHAAPQGGFGPAAPGGPAPQAHYGQAPGGHGPFPPGPHGPGGQGPQGPGGPQGPQGPFGGAHFGGGQPPYGPHGAAAGPAGPGPERRRGGRVVGIAAATALVTSLIVGPAAALGTAYFFPDGLGGPVSSLNGEQGGTATEGEVGEVAEKVLPSVVSIQTANGGGSGVVISSDGQILTNAHVVDAAQGGPLEVLFNDGTSAPAEVLGSDPVSDIAIVQAQGASGLEPAVLGDSDQVGVGADVVAIGSPLGLSGTVTTGVVSALNRPVNTGATESGTGQTSTVINAIQTDAAINPGNSGGPLVNMAGEVIGINTAIAGISQESGSVGLGFAIPINQAKPIAEQLVSEGSASYPAIEATITNSPDGGAAIVEVTEGGAADEAGLRAEDVVVSVEGVQVTTPDQLIAQIRSHRPGEEITLGVRSGGSGQVKDITVTLGEQSAASVEQEAEED